MGVGSGPGSTNNNFNKPVSTAQKETHPVVLLFKLSGYEKLDYELVKEEGPVHDRVFTMKVTVNDTVYQGEGKIM